MNLLLAKKVSINLTIISRFPLQLGCHSGKDVVLLVYARLT